MTHDGEKKWIEQNYSKNYNQQIVMEFWMTGFGSYFQKSQSWSFFIGLIIFSHNIIIKKILDGHPFIWILLMD
jgi:hypothetical protein